MMYVIYDADGNIIKSVDCPANKIDDQLEEGQFYIEGDVHDGTHYVSDGALVFKGEQPSDSHIWDMQVKDWHFDLALAKDLKWTEIKTARTLQEFGTFDWGGYTFQCDEVSQRRIQGAVQLAAIDDTMTLDWTLADDSVQNFTAAEYVQIGQALAIHVSQAHERGRILRQQIDAATSAEELEAIVW